MQVYKPTQNHPSQPRATPVPQVAQLINDVDDTQLTDILKIGFEKGQVYGIIQEHEQWEMTGHCTCSAAPSSSAVTTDAGIQVDLIAPIPQYINASAQSITVDICTPTSCSDASTQSSADFDSLNNAESVDVLCTFSAIAPSSTPLGLVWQRAFKAGAQTSQVNVTNDLAIPPHVDVSVQTPLAEPPPLAIQTTNATHLDWAEDVEPLQCTTTAMSTTRSFSPSFSIAISICITPASVKMSGISRKLSISSSSASSYLRVPISTPSI
jgi:hypothetical protein